MSNPNLDLARHADALGLPAIPSSPSYTPIERGSITERVKRRVAQMRASEDIAATIEAQLFEAADKSESGELGFETR
jgi:hypothetical protein